MFPFASVIFAQQRVLKRLHHFATTAAAVAMLGWWSLSAPQAGEPATPETHAAKKIVLIAGPKSHGPLGNGIHDYPWSVKLIKTMLDNSNVAKQVNVEVHLDGWPKNPNTLNDADTIVVISDGRDGDKYEEAPHFASPENAALVQRQVQRGCGFMTFHFSTFAPNKYAEQILDWSGAYFRWEENGQRRWHSAIQTLEAEVQLATPQHPTLRGVRPFKLRDEFYYNLAFAPAADSIAPIFTVPSLNGRDDRGNVVAWARERDGGGRGFGTTCGHFYDNWKNDDFRRAMLNAIVWTAGVDVPKEGVASRFYSHEEIDAAAQQANKSAELPAAFKQPLDLRQGGWQAADKPEFHDTPFTVECWAQLFSSDRFNILAGKNPKNSGLHWELYTFRDSGELSVYLPGCEPAEIKTGVSITDGRWRHVAFTFDGAHVQLLIDGKLVKETAVKRVSDQGQTSPLWIGALPVYGLSCNGRIDELRFSRGVRTFDGAPQEPLPVDDQTIALWRFDDQKDDKTPDASPNKHQVRRVPKSAQAAREQTDHFFGWKEADAVDARWADMDTGRFFSGTIRAGEQATTRGIAIRVGDQQQAAVMYDTELLRVSSAWSGEFLTFDTHRFGLSEIPSIGGVEQFHTSPQPGWASPDGGFADPRPRQPWGTLPKDWAHYKGLYLHGDRVTLHYTVGGRSVWESPWLETRDEQSAFVRTLQLEPNEATRQAIVSQAIGQVERDKTPAGREIFVSAKDGRAQAVALLAGEHAAALQVGDNERLLLHLPAADAMQQVKLLLWSGAVGDLPKFKALVDASPAAEDLQPLLLPGPTRWNEPIVTQGAVSDDGEAPYVLDTLTLPFDNPYKALFFCSGHDFFSNGDAALCTVHGDVWRVGGIDERLQRLTWKRFATGLFQPLGLKVIGDRVYVVGRDQITILHDLNGDGEADHYENFNNDSHVSHNTHEYATCLETDSTGALYFLRGNSGGATDHDGCLIRVSADGEKMDVFATGFRNANGLGIGPDDTITVSPQEGTWTPGSSIIAVKQGGFYGMMDVHHRPEAPKTFDPPMCWIPRPLDNSSGGQVWATSDKWGPLGGQMLHLSFGRSSMLLALRDQVGDVLQGAVVPLPLDFNSGAARGRFRPHDGQLYVSGLNGWVTNAKQDGCFQRVRYTGQPTRLPNRVSFVEGGVLLGFTEPLDRAAVEEAQNYHVEQWNYRWSGRYGSPDLKVSDPNAEGHDSLAVRGAELLDDGRTLFLAIDDLAPVMQIAIEFSLTTADGAPLKSAVYGSIQKLGPRPSGVGDSIRNTAPGQLDSELAAALQPGLLWRLTQASGAANAVSRRMAALYVPAEEPAASPLAPGPFRAVAEGWLKVDRRGEYQFSFTGRGTATLSLHGEPTLHAAGENLGQTPPQSARLHQGYNRVRIEYESPPRGAAQLQLLWASDNFAPESLPPTLLFHDRRDETLQMHDELRAGRALFAAQGCANCHRTAGAETAALRAQHDIGKQGPHLQDVAARLQPAWVARWALAPHELRNDVTMPQTLGDPASPDARRLAADLAAFLTQSRDLKDETSTDGQEFDDELIEQGLVLYEDLGCISCHRFSKPGDADEHARVSLAHVDGKFQPGALQAFLLAPHAHYPASRMPNFRLSDQEAAALATYLRSEGTASIEAMAELADADPQRGRVAFDERGCVQCHAVDDQPPAAPQRPTVVGKAWNSGCLAAEPSFPAPQHRLSAEQRSALNCFLANNAATLGRETASEASQRLVTTLRCTSCHHRDGASAPWTEILLDEGEQGFPAERLPELTLAGEKIRGAWLRSLFAGEVGYEARPWLKARMPAFPAYAERLAHGLAAEHGLTLEDEAPRQPLDRALVDIGRELSLQQRGLDCRQCHGVETLTPKHENDAQGISFLHIADRLRQSYYERWMVDPLRIDPGTKMPKFTVEGRTAATELLDGDAARQYDALWGYLQTVPATHAATKTEPQPTTAPSSN